jgi:tRNA-dihydrouridine synthase
VADIDVLKTFTGCDGVMIGRAAVGNPWIFARRERWACTFAEILHVVRLHLAEMVTYYGVPAGLVRFRPHLRRYFSGLALKRFLKPLLAAEELADFHAWLQVLENSVPADEQLCSLQKRTWFPFPKSHTPEACSG